MKLCFKCQQSKPIEEFYKHSGMNDGHLNKCKDCTKLDVKRRYYNPANWEKIQAYERSRFTDPERKKRLIEYQRKRRALWPEKNRARALVGKALKKGTLQKLPCEVCGVTEVQAHHEDYLNPLDVRWLCITHHREADLKRFKQTVIQELFPTGS